VIFNPDVYPMNWTWLTGKISEEMFRHEHPREYERLLARGELESGLKPSQPTAEGEPPGSEPPQGPGKEPA
jgi:hypothetical protein